MLARFTATDRAFAKGFHRIHQAARRYENSARLMARIAVPRVPSAALPAIS
jgi:hypothetical protein